MYSRTGILVMYCIRVSRTSSYRSPRQNRLRQSPGSEPALGLVLALALLVLVKSEYGHDIQHISLFS